MHVKGHMVKLYSLRDTTLEENYKDNRGMMYFPYKKKSRIKQFFQLSELKAAHSCIFKVTAKINT